MKKKKTAIGTVFLGGLLFFAIVLSVLTGSFQLDWTQILDSSSSSYTVFWQIRMPRIVLCVLVGAGLGVCGAVMQGLFRNPLADPSLIGISSGAALGANIAIVFGGFISVYLLSDLPEFIFLGLVPISAFLVALMVTWLIYSLANQQGRTNVAVLLLAGVAIQAIIGAVIGLLTYLADDNQLRDMTFWAMGSFNSAQWKPVLVTAVFIIISMLVLLRQSEALNAMMLGENNAFYLGYDVEKLKKRLIVFTALLVGAAVSASGNIGFIGLVVPHLIRLMFGGNHRFLLPASMLLGAAILLFADTAARVIIAPAELPIGIITALLGGPFFIYLLVKQRKAILL